MERYGKSNDLDDSGKMSFSGIRNDATIYRVSQVLDQSSQSSSKDRSRRSRANESKVLSVDLESARSLVTDKRSSKRTASLMTDKTAERKEAFPTWSVDNGPDMMKQMLDFDE